MWSRIPLTISTSLRFFLLGCWMNSRGSVFALGQQDRPHSQRHLPILDPTGTLGCYSRKGVVSTLPGKDGADLPSLQALPWCSLYPRNKPASHPPCLSHYTPSLALSYPTLPHQLPGTKQMLPWEQTSSPTPYPYPPPPTHVTRAQSTPFKLSC